jgi:hypothetical protein
VTHRLREASLHVVEGTSLVVPVIVDGLPERIEVLGRTWERKREFHVTAVSRSVLEAAGRDREDRWAVVAETASGRAVGPMAATGEIRRVRHPDEPALETLIVMVDAPGLAGLHAALSEALDAALTPPPAHVTLYSSDPGRGIGIDDERELAERAPPLAPAAQDAVREAMRYADAFGEDDGVPTPDLPTTIALGTTDPVFTPKALAALAYAAHVHREQRRRGTDTPYLAHLIGVASLVADDGGDELEVIAALLHDAAEDHGGEARLVDIRRRFGARAAEIVERLSDPPVEAWRARKEQYLEALRREHDPATLRVANADKLHNARAILADWRLYGDGVFEKLGKSADELRWYYGELAGLLTERRSGSVLAQELAATVAELSAAL